MPRQTTQTLANILARGVGLGVRKEEAIEEQEERRKELARSIAGIERQRGAAKETGLGRLFGGGFGALITKFALPKLLATLGAPATGGLSLLLPALISGATSLVGQKVATDPKWRPRGARRPAAARELESIGVGAFQVGRGEEREAEFRLGERGFREELSGDILGSALRDAMSAAAFQELLQGMRGLDRAFAPGELSLPRMPITGGPSIGRIGQFAGGPGFRGRGSPVGSIEQSLLNALLGR